jgi:hypothetical protein
MKIRWYGKDYLSTKIDQDLHFLIMDYSLNVQAEEEM